VRKSIGVHWTTVEHITALFSALVASPLYILFWLSSPSTGDGTVGEKFEKLIAPGGLLLSWNAAGVLLIACFTFFGLALQTIGYQNVESTAAAGVMTYLEVPYVFFMQAVIFGEIADDVEILGVVLILSAGFITVFHKRIFALFQR
jgi:drug/metabolite transporter (DMT)-like permease